MKNATDQQIVMLEPLSGRVLEVLVDETGHIDRVRDLLPFPWVFLLWLPFPAFGVWIAFWSPGLPATVIAVAGVTVYLLFFYLAARHPVLVIGPKNRIEMEAAVAEILTDRR